MTTQSQIFDEIEQLIPKNLWEKYRHLSFGEMAEEPELAEYAEKLRQAEKDWWEAEPA